MYCNNCQSRRICGNGCAYFGPFDLSKEEKNNEEEKTLTHRLYMVKHSLLRHYSLGFNGTGWKDLITRY